PNLSLKSLTITCRAAASVIPRNFGDGVRIRSRVTAPTRSSKWFRLRSSWRFSASLAELLETTCSRALFFRSAFCRVHPPPLLRRIVIRVRSVLRRAHRLRHVPQIHSYARPGGGPASHGIHQHVVHGEMCGRLGMLALPPLQTRQGGVFVRRVGHHHKRHLLSRFLSLGFGARRRNAFSFAFHL